MLPKTKTRVPLNVPESAAKEFIKNYEQVTHGKDKFFLFAGDQKVEHLNNDFVGSHVSAEDKTPEHLFKIAAHAPVGAFATQYGLLTQYGMDYKNVPYIVKMNGKSNLVSAAQKDPLSRNFTSFKQVLDLKKQGLNIVGVGYTLYVGSEYESIMIRETQKLIDQAHKHGLLCVIWAYPRGKAVKNILDTHTIAGAAGLVACLGSDFIKVNLPEHGPKGLTEIINAAGRSKLITAGGETKPVRSMLEEISEINRVGAAGNAIGRNIHQRSFVEAVAFAKAIASIIYLGSSPAEAFKLYSAVK